MFCMHVLCVSVCERIAVLAGSGIKKASPERLFKNAQGKFLPQSKKHQDKCKGRKREKIINSSVKTVMRPKEALVGKRKHLSTPICKKQGGERGETKV